MERLTHGTVTFLRPFALGGVDGDIPPGQYAVEIAEEQLSGLSFVAYRRVSTSITIPVGQKACDGWQVVAIDPTDLERALARDAAPIILPVSCKEVL